MSVGRLQQDVEGIAAIVDVAEGDPAFLVAHEPEQLGVEGAGDVRGDGEILVLFLPKPADDVGEVEPVPGLADNGDLELDLHDLLEASGQAAQQTETALAIFIDELQYVAEEELAALISALHRTSQRRLPVVLVGAGLPQLRGHMGRAKSYAERLFDFPEVGPLTADAASARKKIA